MTIVSTGGLTPFSRRNPIISHVVARDKNQADPGPVERLRT